MVNLVTKDLKIVFVFLSLVCMWQDPLLRNGRLSLQVFLPSLYFLGLPVQKVTRYPVSGVVLVSLGHPSLPFFLLCD